MTTEPTMAEWVEGFRLRCEKLGLDCDAEAVTANLFAKMLMYRRMVIQLMEYDVRRKEVDDE